MKDTEVIYLNEQHQKIVSNHIKMVKRLIYYATEEAEKGKFQDFLTILRSIYMYSNNFYNTEVDKKKCDRGTVSEFLFLIPNMSFYMAIGFLTGLKNSDDNLDLRDRVERIAMFCEDTTSELADILIDEEEKKNILKEITQKN